MAEKPQEQVPARLPEDRRFFVRDEDGGWSECVLQTLRLDDVLAIVYVSETGPQDVELFMVYGVPYTAKTGLWTVEVKPYKPVPDKE